MPLKKSASKKALKSNIKTLMGEVGKSPHVQSKCPIQSSSFGRRV